MKRAILFAFFIFAYCKNIFTIFCIFDNVIPKVKEEGKENGRRRGNEENR